MNKILISMVLFLSVLLLPSISSQEIIYPIAELENCESESACQTYCDNIQNIEVCIDAAEKYGLMTAEEIAEAKRVIPFLKAGTTPGQCKSKLECNAYCDKEENIIECVDFALKIGDIDEKEAEMIKKTGGKGPGGCKKNECETYCDDETHINECVDFAVQNGMIDAKEAEMIKKTGGKGPGGCKKNECDTFCQKEENFATCVDFAVQNGLMDAKDAEMAKRTGGKGPGGCKSKEECDAFCNNPDNQETCTNFAIENNLLSEDELEGMKKNQEFTNSEEGKCKTQCLKDSGISFKDCGKDGSGPEACKTCDDKCFQHNNGNCLNQEKWQQLDADCKAKGSGHHLEEVRGDDGYGGECVVDETCVYSSEGEWESQEEKDRKLAEMQKQWDDERARYESEQGPGSSTDSGGSGGCTQPGPEGQCNPGPGAGDSSGGTTPGDATPSSDTGTSSEDSSSTEDSVEESAPVTGGVIVKINPSYKLKNKFNIL